MKTKTKEELEKAMNSNIDELRGTSDAICKMIADTIECMGFMASTDHNGDIRLSGAYNRIGVNKLVSKLTSLKRNLCGKLDSLKAIRNYEYNGRCPCPRPTEEQEYQIRRAMNTDEFVSAFLGYAQTYDILCDMLPAEYGS